MKATTDRRERMRLVHADRAERYFQMVESGMALKQIAYEEGHGARWIGRILMSHPTYRARALAKRSFDWTEEVIDTLRSEWAKGTSASAIGKLLKISRNAVIGKAHRLNLSKRHS